MRHAIVLGAAFLVAHASAPPTVHAQEGYQTPPPSLARLVDAPLTPEVQPSPDGATLLILHRPTLGTIAELAKPELRLAGLRINPANNGPSRDRGFDGLSLLGIDESEREVTGLPDGPIRNVSWASDGRRFAFTVDLDDRIELYVAEVESGRARRLLDRPLNDAGEASPYRWVDERSVVLLTVPPNRGVLPVAPTVPMGPVIQENQGEPAPARTYQDLLEDSHDEALFAHLLTSQIVLASIDGTSAPVGPPALYTDVRPSPNGAWFLVEYVHEPFSYLVPIDRFPLKIEVWDEAGTVVREVAALSLAEDVPTAFGSVRTGVRRIRWRPDVPAALFWAEALDGGDAHADAEFRDRLMTLAAPFAEEPTEWARLSLRYAGTEWTEDGRALVSETWYSSRQRRTYVVEPSGAAEPRLLIDVSTEDRYADPGEPLTRATPRGTRIVHSLDGGTSMLMVGEGASPEGNRPFLRQMDLDTGETEELFRSSAPYYEVPVQVLDDEGRTLLTQRESLTDPPNLFVRDLQTGSAEALTAFPHPHPELAEIHREPLMYEREDGVALSATLYLPAGYDQTRDGPLPALVWAYPREFKSSLAAGQRSDSPYQFPRVSYWGAIPYVTQGYAVIDDAAMPVVGQGEAEPNDTFREQLVANARAAIEEGARRGVVDPDRVAIGGHSYGAFMTANLLAHSDLFRAGVARSGAYNRTLTPFGFQREERLFWEAPEIYFYMSPFMHAEKVDEPILLIHGMADNNSGTFPVQSERFYAALKGLGGTARLVMLPHESHGYRARESILHMLWETNRWLDLHVRNAEPREKQVTEAPPVS
jgi:dipeptidyl aminopeptidase/acylaminoacyl peptidase